MQYSYVAEGVIPSGPDGTRKTLKVMRELSRAGKRDPVVRQCALDLTRHLMQKDFRGEAKSCSDFVRDEVRYVRDIHGIETIQTPATTLSVRAGDCDDKCVLLASLLQSIGHPVRFIAIGLFPYHFSHVLCETRVGTRWVPCETTEPWEFGRGPGGVASYMRMHV